MIPGLPIPGLGSSSPSLTGGTAGPATSANNSGFDSSGWAVSFGAGQASATGSNDPLKGLDTATLGPLALAALVVLLIVMRKRKKG